MNHTEHNAKTPSRRTGFSATLRFLPRRRGSAAPSSTRLVALLCLACAATMALAATPALAAETHNFLSTFDASDAPGGSLVPLEGSIGLAVDNSGTATDGRVYADDTVHNVVDAFAPSGAYVSQITGSETVQGSFSTTYGLTVDQSDGSLYVADYSHGVVDKFDSAGKVVKAFGEEGQLTGTSTPQLSMNPTGVAVDPETGDLYVADNTHSVIDVFNSSGAYQRQFSTNGGGLLIAVDSQGNLFFTNGTETDVYVAATGALNPAYGSGSGTLDSGGSLGVSVDPANDDVYVADNEHIAQYSKTGALLSSFGQGNLFGTFGVGVGDTAAKVYAGNSGAAHAVIFGPLVPELALKVSITGSGSVTSSPSGINCGEGLCEAEFGEGSQIILTATRAVHNEFAGWTGCDNVTAEEKCEVTMSAAKEVKAEFTPIPQQTLKVSITGSGSGEVTSSPVGIACTTASSPCTEHFDSEGSESTVTLSAALGPNSVFTGWTGCDEVPSATECKVTMSAAKEVKADFAPLPIAETQAADHLEPVLATLHGTLNPQATAIENCHFDYVTVAAFNVTEYSDLSSGGSAPCVPTPSGSSPVAVSAAIGSLTPNTTYVFRLQASNSIGTGFGASQVFTAPSAPPTATTLPATAIGRTGATLHGAFNPENSEATYHFAYIDQAGYEAALAKSAPNPYAAGATTPTVYGGSGLVGQPASARIDGLRAATTYHFALLVVGPGGLTTGADATFTTAPAQPPLATTETATAVAPTTATLNATVDPDGLMTAYRLELGTTTAYGATAFGSVGEGHGAVPVSVAFMNLAPAATYHFRVVATNADGTATGADAAFTTAALPQGVLPPPPGLKPTPVTPPRSHKHKHHHHHHKRHHTRHANTNRRAGR